MTTEAPAPPRAAAVEPPQRRFESPRQSAVRRRRERPLLGLLGWSEDFVHFAVALVLLAVALMVLYRTSYDLATTGQPFATAATSAVNGVLFAIIVMEVMRTVISHFETGGLQLQPFLIIGIVSAVREVLTVGAKLSLQGSQHEPTTAVLHSALLELGVNAAVVFGLVVSLVLVRRLAGMGEND